MPKHARHAAPLKQVQPAAEEASSKLGDGRQGMLLAVPDEVDSQQLNAANVAGHAQATTHTGKAV